MSSRNARRRLLALAGLLIARLAGAQAPAERLVVDVADASRMVQRLEEQTAVRSASLAQLHEGAGEAAAVVSSADAGLKAAGLEQQTVAAAVKALGAPTAGEPAETATERARQQARQQMLELQVRDLTALKSRAERLSADLGRRAEVLARRMLLLREPGVGDLLGGMLRAPGEWGAFGAALAAEWRAPPFDQPLALAVGALLCAALWLLGWWWGRAARGRVAEPAETFTAELSRAWRLVTARQASWLMLLAGLAAGLGWQQLSGATQPLLTAAAYGLLLALALRAVAAALLVPPEPARALVPLDERLRRALARRLGVLLLLAAAGYVLLVTARGLTLPQRPYLLLRALLVVVLTLNLGELLWLMDRFPTAWARGSRLPRLLLLMALTGGAVAELMGYRNLAVYLLRGLFFTLALSPLAWLLLRFLDEACEGLNRGTGLWVRGVRTLLGVPRGEPFPGLAMLRTCLFLLLWSGIGLLLVRIWVTAAGFAAALRCLDRGFGVGGLKLVPSRLLLGVCAFGLLGTLRVALVAGLARRLAAKHDVDPGAREATVAVVSYAAFALVLVVALNLVGLNLQSVTVVAGALSVGIGFGLQNIVNNFVSGLILLFERPIKPGDWIRVGAVEGRVSRLSVRSTELRTADRAEVILPNGDLLTQPVTNLTRYDTQGRILLPLAVVHDADPAAVRELLLAVAAEHPLVLDAPPAAPQVLLRGFTEAAANYELRCVVRDVEQAQAVTSDLYFAVAEAFRSHGIALSFGQRDAWKPPAAE